MTILENISLKNLNTFGLEAKARYFVETISEEELKEAISYDLFKHASKLVLGGGSNILLTADFDGLVIKISIPGIKIIEEDKDAVFIEAGAGVVWNYLVHFCVERNFGGIENLSLIPGTVGAAPIQNIGAYGQELKDVLYLLKGISISEVKEKTFQNDECKFDYRDSIFKNELKGKFIVTSIILRLSRNPKLNLSYGSVKDEIEKLNLKQITVRDVSNVISNIRRRKLPDPAVTGNAGSYFRNPEVDEIKFLKIKEDFPDVIAHKQVNGNYKIAAGWMIEKCGWKGKRIGNTGSHAKQSLVIVNYGGAEGKEILMLAGKIKNSVKQKFDIVLTEEVNIY